VITIDQSTTKTLKIGARVTPEQKKEIKKLMRAAGFRRESEYVLSCCLKVSEIKQQSPYALNLMRTSGSKRILFKVTEVERELIIKRYEASRYNNFSRFVRNCCMGNPILIVGDIKGITHELHKVGNNLNQLTLLCHQGLITAPDLTEIHDLLLRIYHELIKIVKKIDSGR